MPDEGSFEEHHNHGSIRTGGMFESVTYCWRYTPCFTEEVATDLKILPENGWLEEYLL